MVTPGSLSITNNKTVAVTGGTGHLGYNLIRELLQRGYAVRALIRKHSHKYEQKNLEWIQGDLNDRSALKKLQQGASVLIHCASKISIGEIDRKTVYEVNVKGTENLLLAIRNKPIRFIFISSSSAVTTCKKGEVFDENRPLKKSKALYYAWTKAQGELLVNKEFAQQNLNGLILRPTAIIGPVDPVPSRFGQTILDLKNGTLPFVTNGGYNLIDVRDLSRTIVNSIKKGKSGSTYLLSGEFRTLKEIASVANPSNKPGILHVNLLLLLLPLIRLYNKAFQMKWPISKDSLLAVKNAPRHMDSSKAKNDLDHHSRPVEKSIKELLEWFDKNRFK